ncbi:hypothetical protein LJC00_00345 [Dysgonomonas sp. OttesenSCG-928-M03]|nr:hypothetical protein [Dysgonomonas sp. OttesenSCG-928-M03]
MKMKNQAEGIFGLEEISQSNENIYGGKSSIMQIQTIWCCYNIPPMDSQLLIR